MRDEFEMPLFDRIGGKEIEVSERSCMVEIEPDEDSGLTTFYITSVWVHGEEPNHKPKWHAVPERDPLFEKIKQFAYTRRSKSLELLWELYLADLPAARRPLSDFEEHGTYRAGAL